MRLPLTDSDSEGPNLTPVIDVVFLLLIFFLVATRFDQEERELTVQLPVVVQAQPLSMTSEVIVNINRTGEFTVSQQTYTEAQLLTILQEARRNNPHQSVLIRADGKTAWEYGVRVMGLCNRAEIDNYRVAALQDPRLAGSMQ